MLPQQLPGWTEENQEKYQSGELISEPKFEPRISQIKSRRANYSHLKYTLT
jgi:hypothetical protein